MVFSEPESEELNLPPKAGSVGEPEQVQLLNTVGFSQRGCINYLSPVLTRTEETRPDWQHKERFQYHGRYQTFKIAGLQDHAYKTISQVHNQLKTISRAYNHFKTTPQVPNRYKTAPRSITNTVLHIESIQPLQDYASRP
ncbi:hypothetical protein J6590_039463 [Homalodisca vitripennis]|nr:hypothetical protein J6590_039463 [Homalodisca vitripennis]